nr:MAG TPA: hypothetical protein [Inoviridae sp.]
MVFYGVRRRYDLLFPDTSKENRPHFTVSPNWFCTSSITVMISCPALRSSIMRVL